MNGEAVVDSGSQTTRLVVISAGVSEPSSTRLLADRAAQASIERLRDRGHTVSLSVIELAPLAVDTARAVVTGITGERVRAAIDTIAAADGIIAAVPVYKAGISGVFKSFIDLIDDDLLIAKPTILAATAGTARHAMVVDEQMRPLFAFVRAMPVPTSLFAAPDDWASPALGERIARAASELALLIGSGVGREIADGAWMKYQHRFAGAATRAARTATDVDFTTDLMRLATGGRVADTSARAADAG